MTAVRGRMCTAPCNIMLNHVFGCGRTASDRRLKFEPALTEVKPMHDRMNNGRAILRVRGRVSIWCNARRRLTAFSGRLQPSMGQVA